MRLPKQAINMSGYITAYICKNANIITHVTDRFPVVPIWMTTGQSFYLLHPVHQDINNINIWTLFLLTMLFTFYTLLDNHVSVQYVVCLCFMPPECKM